MDKGWVRMVEVGAMRRLVWVVCAVRAEENVL